MPFTFKKQTFHARIRPVTLGTGEKAMTLGGQKVLPFCSFDDAISNSPRVGIVISDTAEAVTGGEEAFYAACTTPAERAGRAQQMLEADFICLYLKSADPNGENRSVEACVETAKAVAGEVTKPLVIMGCRNAEKDARLFAQLAEALQGRNVLLLSAKDENYKAVAETAAGQKLGAESAVDINLAKQLNTVMVQSGVGKENIVMNIGSAAAGYGFDYVASALDRVRDAALRQDDDLLQMPIITPVFEDAWSVKEALMPEEEMPQWGSAEERGIAMEITTAAAVLASGSDAVILRHPESVRTISHMIESLA